MSSSSGPRWTPPALLERLDREVVPVLQRSARSVAGLLGRPFRAVTRAELRTRLGRALHRNVGLLLLGAVAIAFLASAVHLQRYPGLRDADALSAGGSTGALPGARGAGAASPAVGPVVGADVDDYLERAGAGLDDLPGDDPQPAVVSYGEYRTPEEVLASLPATAEVLSVQYRLPSEQERPQRLDTDRDGLVATVEEVVEGAREQFAEEEREVQRLLDSGTVEEESFREDLELRLSELATIRDVLAGEAPVVFAVVVRAPPDDLRALSEHDAVRLVDAAPGDDDGSGLVFYGVLPEDQDRVTYGRDL